MRVTFGTDGIRGEANKELSPELALLVGKSAAYHILNSGGQKNRRIAIGKDTRLSGDMLEGALIAGITSVGAEVFRLGIVPTPCLAYLTRQLRCDCGIMISASHNPVGDNGIKIFSGDGYKLDDETEKAIAALIESDGEGIERVSGDEVGTAVDKTHEANQYVGFIRDMLKGIHFDGEIVIDCANGAASRWAKRVFRDCADTVHFINSDEDGRRINVDCGSTKPEKLGARVRKLKARFGFAFDGDADRVLFVDEKGELVDGDKIMLICGRLLMKKGALKDNTIVATVMSNMGFERALEAEGAHMVRAQVGDKYVLREMQKHGYALGGEQSGHVIFLNESTTGDGLITASQALIALSMSDAPVSEQTAMKRSAQFLKNVRVPDRDAFDRSDAIRKKIEDVTRDLGDAGRIVVRKSGTEPLIRVMVETWNAEEAERLTDDIIDTVKTELGVN